MRRSGKTTAMARTMAEHVRNGKPGGILYATVIDGKMEYCPVLGITDPDTGEVLHVRKKLENTKP